MSQVNKIIMRKTRQLIEEFFSISDTLEHAAFLSRIQNEYGITTLMLTILTGIDVEHINNRKQAAGAIRALESWENSSDSFKELTGQQHGSNYPEKFKAMIPVYAGVILSRTDHGVPDWTGIDQDTWLNLCPDRWVIHCLREAVENPDTVLVLYKDILGRWPDAAGEQNYNEELKAGRQKWEIVREIELSDEALSMGE